MGKPCFSGLADPMGVCVGRFSAADCAQLVGGSSNH